jgi:hypothetical protein
MLNVPLGNPFPQQPLSTAQVALQHGLILLIGKSRKKYSLMFSGKPFTPKSLHSQIRVPSENDRIFKNKFHGI